MARISTYPIDSTPSVEDMVIGTEVDNLDVTKNYRIGDILALNSGVTSLNTLKGDLILKPLGGIVITEVGNDIFIDGTNAGGSSSFTINGDGGLSPLLTKNGTLSVYGINGLFSSVSQPVVGSADITIRLQDTGVIPGIYTNTNLTVDAQGRITNATNGTGSSGVTSITNAADTGIGTAITGIGTFTYSGSGLISTAVTGTTVTISTAATDSTGVVESLGGNVGANITNTIGGTEAVPIVISVLNATGTPGPTTFLSGNNTWAVPAGGGGGVTSVGLSAPSAFTVTNSPVTGIGTLTFAGAGLTTDYVDGTGSLQSFPTIPSVPTNIVETVDTTDGGFIALTPVSPASGNVVITADLSAVDGTDTSGLFLSKDNVWSAPSGGGAGTTYDLASAQDGTNVDITLTPSTGTVDTVQLTAGSGITLTDNGSNNITIDAAGGGSGLWTATGNDIYNNNSNAVVIGKTTAAVDTTASLEVSGRISQVDLGYSVFIGLEAGLNDDLNFNRCVGIGYRALKTNTTGTSNIAIGSNSLVNNTTGGSNIAFGTSSLESNTTGTTNIGIGTYALRFCATGQYNIAVGSNALSVATSGLDNIAIGRNAGRNSQGTDYNVFIGSSAGNLNGTGGSNTGIGHGSLLTIGSGSKNAAIGSQSGAYSVTPYSGFSNVSSNSVYIGVGTVSSASGNTNEIVIGFEAIGKGSNTATIGNNSTVETHLRGVVITDGKVYSQLPGVLAGTTAIMGMRTFILNGGTPTYGGNASGGGSNVLPVFYNGTNWIYA